MKSFRAFTLAEVLITLGIVGVVAAMTLPTVIANIENARNVAVLRRAYSDVSKLLVLFDNEMSCDGNLKNCAPGELEFVEKFSEYLIDKHKFTEIPANNRQHAYISHKNFNKNDGGWPNGFLYMGGYLLKERNGNYIINVGRNLQDNSYSTADYSHIRASVIIVTNPKKYYQQYRLRTGYDIFMAFINDKEKVVPGGSKFCGNTRKSQGYFCVNNYDNNEYCTRETNPTPGNQYDSNRGYGCFQRIIDDGWKITY